VIHSFQKEDDIISNPSEEEKSGVEQVAAYHPGLSLDLGTTPPRPLPPLPHSRVASGQLSAHDPAHAHSRNTSNPPDIFQQQPSMNGRRNSLNPFAKPFVFGARHDSGTLISDPLRTMQGSSFPPTHSRVASLGKPLNATAQEFKPGGFTFRPPPGMPRLAFPAPESARPLPLPPVVSTPVRAQHGREKRQRRGSSASFEGEDGMHSFKFPAPPGSGRRSEPPSPGISGSRRSISPNRSAPPFTFSNDHGMSFEPTESSPLPYSLLANAGTPDETLQNESTAKAEDNESILRTGDPTLPSAVKIKRAPVPLDFKHSTSSNTIPAGVFKALVNAGDDKTRRTVRSRLGSREIYEHGRLPSLDDLNVPPISRKKSRNQLTVDPGQHEPPKEVDDVFGSHVKRRSSLPSGLHSATQSSHSGISIPAVDLTGKFQMQRYEQRLESILDEKVQAMCKEILQIIQPKQTLNISTEAMLNDVISLFRTQMQQSTARDLDDSQIDGRGELDFKLLKGVVQQGQAELLVVLRRELDEIVDRLGRLDVPAGLSHDMNSFVEQLYTRTANDLSDAITRLSDRIESIDLREQTWDGDTLVDKLLSKLGPILASLRSDPVDYEYLTAQLTQAVKPHISQLIDLASDKRETAGLIVDKILPLLPRSTTPAFDMDAVTGHLTTEIRRLITPIDPFEIKEQVADLVIERLDSRLALRDRTFNVDTISGKVNEGVTRLLEPVQLTNTLKCLVEGQGELSKHRDGLTTACKDILNTLSDLPQKLVDATEALNAAETEARSRTTIPIPSPEADKAVHHIGSVVEDLAGNQQILLLRHDELVTAHRDIYSRLEALSESFATVTNALQGSAAAITLSYDTLKQEADELRKLNAEYQAQLGKARTAHGQVRVEKDVLGERLAEVESERDYLRTQIQEIQADAASKASEAAPLHAKVFDLEDALTRGLERLKAADVAAQVNQERIDDLEKSNRELTTEKQSLKAKVCAHLFRMFAASPHYLIGRTPRTSTHPRQT
jgi:hypothetical protein